MSHWPDLEATCLAQARLACASNPPWTEAKRKGEGEGRVKLVKQSSSSSRDLETALETRLLGAPLGVSASHRAT